MRNKLYCRTQYNTKQKSVFKMQIPKPLGRWMFENFLINFFASIHPDYEKRYSESSKNVLRNAFFRARSISIKYNKVSVWTPERLYGFFEEHDMMWHLLFVPIEKEYRELVLPTFWFHKNIIEEIMYQFN